MGIFSRNKKPKEKVASPSLTLAQHKTPQKTKAQIIVEFTQDNLQSGEHNDFFDYNDLGVPLAIAIIQDMVDLTDSGLIVFEETWSDLCQIHDVDPRGAYEQLADLSDEDYEMTIPLEGNSLNIANQLLSDAKWPSISFDKEEPLSFEDAKDGLLMIILEVTGEYLLDDQLDMLLMEEIGIDSMSLVEITIAVEDKFDVSIPNEEAQAIRTARQAANLVLKKRAMQ
jgi:acyl carrier protein